MKPPLPLHIPLDAKPTPEAEAERTHALRIALIVAFALFAVLAVVVASRK